MNGLKTYADSNLARWQKKYDYAAKLKIMKFNSGNLATKIIDEHQMEQTFTAFLRHIRIHKHLHIHISIHIHLHIRRHIHIHCVLHIIYNIC